MSDVTRRLAAGLAGAVAALTAITAGSAAFGAGTEPPRDVPPADVAALAPGAAQPRPAGDVLPVLDDDAPMPSGAALDSLLTPLLAHPALGDSVSLNVVDLVTGEQLTLLGGDAAREPASTAKLLTAAAALTTLGPQETLPTRVVARAGTDEVTLVGGGDVLLDPGAGDPTAVNGHAGLGDLARRTAAALKADGRTSVAVRLDDTLFAGPAVSPAWRGSDVDNGFVAPVHAVAVNAGRTRSGKYAPRTGDPAMAAATQFAAQLRRAGIGVRGGVTRAAAGEGTATLAEVRSASVGDLVEYALTESDNTVSEVLARLVAARDGERATFAGAGAAVLRKVAALGVEVNGAVLADGSGLGDGSRVAPRTLTGVLAAAASQDHPELRPLLTGLPVAGVSGTLVDRFEQRAQRPAAGTVRAKTGSLSGVSSLAGTVVDADGRSLAFAVLADQVGAGEPARRALDSLVAALATCGCR